MNTPRLTCVLVICSLLLMSGCRQKSPTEPVDGGSSVDARDREFTAKEYAHAELLHRRGIAHMENMEWGDAEKTFTELVGLMPESRAVLRNHAILRVLALTEPNSPYRPSGSADDRAGFADAVESARTAIRTYRTKMTPADDQSLADLLLGKLLVRADRPESPSFDEGMTALRKAAGGRPEQADFRMAVAAAMLENRANADSSAVLQELQRAFELAPTNLHVMRLLLENQALALRSPDTAAQETAATRLQVLLPKVVEMVQPLNESVLKHTRVDLVETLNAAIEGESADASTLMRPAMVVSNTIKAEIPVQIDMRRIDRHLLEYVVPRFSDDFYQAARAAGVFPEPGKSVLKEFTSASLPAELTGITDVSVADITLNGLEDLAVVRSGILEVYSRESVDSGSWSLIMTGPGESSQWTHMILADIDRDSDPTEGNLESPHILEDRDGDRRIVRDSKGESRWYDTDVDVVVWNDSELEILRNTVSDNGRRLLESVSRHAFNTIRDVVAADIEADGDLDFVIASSAGVSVLSNSNGTAFATQDVSDVDVLQLAVGDVDRNIAMDIVGIGADGPGLLQNLFHERFRWLPGQDVFGDSTAGEQIAIADVDGNLSWDIICGSETGLRVCLTKTVTPGVISPLETRVVMTRSVNDFASADLDKDGYLDIAVVTDAGVEIWRGSPSGQFTRMELQIPEIIATRIDTADLDQDGDPDLLIIAGDGTLRQYDNQGGNDNHWINVVVRGKADDPQFKSRRVNMHAIGSVLEVMAGPLWQAHVVDAPVMHIGLGKADHLDAIRILWTDGVPQDIVTEDHLRPRIGILVPQILKGSCPYIYTWTGERFEFFSDCLWSAPIGLVQANGDFAPTREWENLLIPGKQLVPRDGEYVLQITEELWEIAYFDQVKLVAIDHPSDVQIFTNEKAGPPSLAAHRIHTVRNPRTPKSVVDGRGTDLLPGLRHRDGDYVRAFESRQLQGLTDEWTMEFDLGEISHAGDIRLFLTGWIFPTDTSLNLQIEKNADLSPPAPPVVEIPDRDGGWKVAKPFIGFPSGKTKVMVVDLSDVVGPGNSRIRLRSTMELYFDQAFFTAGESDVPTVGRNCELAGADLHARGFSRRIYSANSVFRDGNAPEGYDYDHVTTEPRWPPISGRFTRYGAAGDLLANADDRIAVLGPGDELTVRFFVPDDPVPDGWNRDFVLRNVGWDKDADVNTVYGQSSEPLPFRAMTRYPVAEADSAPQSSEYMRYLDEYQTRQYSPFPFWRGRRGMPSRVDAVRESRSDPDSRPINF